MLDQPPPLLDDLGSRPLGPRAIARARAAVAIHLAERARRIAGGVIDPAERPAAALLTVAEMEALLEPRRGGRR